MTGGGENWIDQPWDWMTGIILLGMGWLSGELFGAQEFDGSKWG